MKKHLRKVFSVVLAGSMLMTAVPTGMYAEEPVREEVFLQDEAAQKAAEEAQAAQKAAEEAEAARKAAEEAQAAQKAAEEAEAVRKAAEEAEAARKAAEEAQAAQKAAEEAQAARKTAAEEAAKAQGGESAGQEGSAEGGSKPPAENAGAEQSQAQQDPEPAAPREDKSDQQQAAPGEGQSDQQQEAAPGEGQSDQQQAAPGEGQTDQRQTAPQEGHDDQQQAVLAEGGESQAPEAVTEQTEAPAEDQDGGKGEHLVMVKETVMEEEQTLGEAHSLENKSFANKDYAAEVVSEQSIEGDDWTLTKDGTPVADKKAIVPGSYVITNGEDTYSFAITKASVDVTWSGVETTYPYSGEDLATDRSAEFLKFDEGGTAVTATALDISVQKDDTIPQTIRDAGIYTLTASLTTDEDKACYELTGDNIAITVTVTPKYLTAVWTDEDEFEYDGNGHGPTVTSVGEDGVTWEVIYEGIEGTVYTAGTEKPVNAGEYKATVKITGPAPAANYDVSEAAGAKTFVIDKCEIGREAIIVTPPTVYNGAVQPVTAVFERAAGEQETDLGKTGPLRIILDGEDITDTGVKNAGPYTVILAFTGDDALNYAFEPEITPAANEAEFTVARRGITIHPDTLSKKFGTADTRPYTYDKTVLSDNEATVIWAGTDADGNQIAIRSELPDDLLDRKPGELVGKYEYSVDPKYAPGGANDLTNYDITVDNATPYEIEKLKLTAQDKSITSRQGRFAFSTDMLGEKKAKTDTNVARKLVIRAEFPEDAKGVRFSTELDDYISNAAAGISFTEKEGFVSIRDHIYSTTRNKKTLSWAGKLPAGTKLTLAVYGRSEALGEEWTIASNTAAVEIVKQPVAMAWGSTADAAPAITYLGRDDRLTLTAVSQTLGEFTYDGRNEFVEVRYDGTHYYESLDQQIRPVESNSGSTHNVQTASATFVDALNLEFSPVSYAFIYDTGAFEIPSGNIRFHNRDKKISITLPEAGTVKSVTIPGAEVELTGAQGEKFEFDVSWSGHKLIPADTGIQVTYTDRGGSEGRGSASVARSTVNTPIRLKIRPEVNGRGYLTGRGTLVVSGTACSCEPLSITVAGMTKSATVAAKDVWADENGSFEVSFDMNREALPERTAFSVFAEYTDVNGQGAALTASYDEFANAAGVVSPVFRAMSFISGMAELDSTVILRIGGKSYEAPMDSFGHFAFSSVDMMMPGDTFTVSVIDIAGNENNKATFTIPGADEPVTGSLGAIGRFFYNAGEERSCVYTATPIRVLDVADAGMELPLLFGGSYKAGTMTITRGAGGLTMQSQLDPEIFVNEEDYSVSGDTFYVYTGKPTVEQLQNHSGGIQYHFGDTVPAGSSDVLWIVDGRTLQMSVSDAGELEPYNFLPLSDQEKQAHPERDQEYASYLAFQEF